MSSSRQSIRRSMELRQLLDRVHPPAPPRRLREEDTHANYMYVLEDDEHGHTSVRGLVKRVLRGTKPMASVMIRNGRKIHASERVLRKVARHLGLACDVVLSRMKTHVAVLYQPGATLGDFYDWEDVTARYAAVGVVIPPEYAACNLTLFSLPLANEDFMNGLKYPMMGLCLGYPVGETLRLLNGSA